jgi:ferritin-like metal-binding protein YciE
MSVETLEELLIDELKDLYSAEKQIVRSLPKLAKAATSPELQEAL